MTFLSYKLPDGAPQKLVWFAECDVCRATHLGPFPNAPKVEQRAAAESAGWRYQREHPMDTCPGCLAAETLPDAGPEPESGSWRDRHGDVWTLGSDGLLHSFETQSFPHDYVEKKWGPLTTASADPKQGDL